MKNKKILIIPIIAALIIINIKTVWAKTGVVTTETLRVRKSASTTSTIIDMINQGDKIEIEGEEGDWYKITINGKTGYISKEYVKITNETSKPKETYTPSEQPLTTPSLTPAETPVETPATTPDVTTEPSEQPSTEPTTEPTPSEATEPQAEPEKPTQKILGDVTNKEIDTYIIPSFSSVKTSKIRQGQKVQIIKTLGNWSKVSSDSIEGWIPNSAIMVEVQH